MGVKSTSRESKEPDDGTEAINGSRDSAPSTSAGELARPSDKQTAVRRKIDSVLDDVMGDPEDFRDFADSDGESGGGRWEDSVRASLEHEEAGNGAVHEDNKESEGGVSGESREASSLRLDDESEAVIDLLPSGSSPSRDQHDLGLVGSNERGLSERRGSEGSRMMSDIPHDDSASKPEKPHQTRYFIIKSLNHHNIMKSIENGIWATQAMNEPVLNEAFKTSETVLLVFSVNMSGHFQGYARMASPIGRRRANVWTEGNEGTNPWGGSFRVEWVRLYDLPFQKTIHLKNPLNFFKPVKISRDCQELTQEIGDALCALIDDGADSEGKPKRKGLLADFRGGTSKKKKGEPFGSFADISGRRRLASSANGAPHFSGGYVPHYQTGSTHDFGTSAGRVSGSLPSQISGALDRLRVSKSRSPHLTATEKRTGWDRDHHRDYRRRDRETPAEPERLRDVKGSSIGRAGDVPVDDDLLNMVKKYNPTYEEYLQRHGHGKEYGGFQQGPNQYLFSERNAGYGGNWMAKNLRTPSSDHQYSSYVGNWYSRQDPASPGCGFSGTGAKKYPSMASCPPWTSKEDERGRRLARSSDVKAGARFWESRGREPVHIERGSEAGS